MRSQWLVCFFLPNFLEGNLVCMCCQLSMTFVGNVVVVVLTSLMVVDSSFWRERKGNLVVC